ncbi:MAG: pentapeptide repeat-containing protein [Anaerolineales bacterium]|nr:pentapeptide repeat-containing protein [Anaerolineales bacterium]
MKTSPSREIHPPRQPKRLPAGFLSTLQDDGEYSALELSGCRWTGQSAARPVFETMVFRKAVLGPSRLAKPRLADCHLENSDLSGIVWEQARFRRVEFLECRIIGAQLLESDYEDVLFRNCILERAVISSAKFRAARFSKCKLREASFEYTDLSGVVFEDCDLTRADLRRAKLAGADLRGSQLDGVQAGPEEFSGAIVDSTQALQIAGLLGVVIREKGEDPGP